MYEFLMVIHPNNNIFFLHIPDIKVILDFVPNHTSNESMWFEEALKGHDKYYDYFMWEDGVVDESGNLQPPNNWVRLIFDREFSRRNYNFCINQWEIYIQ